VKTTVQANRCAYLRFIKEVKRVFGKEFSLSFPLCIGEAILGFLERILAQREEIVFLWFFGLKFGS